MEYLTNIDVIRAPTVGVYTVRFYYFNTSTTGTKPFGDGFLLEFIWGHLSGAYTAQVAFEDSGDAITIRHFDGGRWFSWKSVTLT